METRIVEAMVIRGGLSDRGLTGLSIRQPWADLIVEGRKTIEVRSWTTRHRGKLVIHAGATPDREALRHFEMRPADRIFGAIIGDCELYDCFEFDEASWERMRCDHLNLGPLVAKRYGWLLRNARRHASATPLKGKLGLMRLPEERVANV